MHKLTAFFKKILPWFVVHALICCGIAAYYAMKIHGTDGAKKYYIPLALGLVIAAITSFLAYFSFGREDKKYNNTVLGEFDIQLIYNHFCGKYVKQLSEAVIDMHLLDFNNALNKYNELEEKELNDNQRAVLCFYIGRCYHLMGYPTNGAKYYLEALNLGLKFNDLYLLLARCLVQNGRFDDAIKYYNIMLEQNSYYDFIYTDIGITYLKMGDSKKALEFFEKSIAEGKNYSFALGGCSLAYLQMKNLEKSKEYYCEALRCNMEDVNGFKVFYCNIAEAAGLYDEIDPNMKLKTECTNEIVR